MPDTDNGPAALFKEQKGPRPLSRIIIRAPPPIEQKSDVPLFYEYKGGVFKSPFAGVIKRWREKKRLQKLVRQGKLEDREMQVKTVPQRERQTLYSALNRNEDNFDPWEMLPGPKLLSSIEKEVFKGHLVSFLYAPLRFYGKSAGFHLSKDKCLNTVSVGDSIAFVQNAYGFQELWSEMKLPIIQGCVQLAAGSVIKSSSWLVRSLRLFYYEMRGELGNFRELFKKWVCRKLPTPSLARRFVSNLYVTLAATFYLHSVNGKIRENDVESKIAVFETLQFLFLYESNADYQQTSDFFATRA